MITFDGPLVSLATINRVVMRHFNLTKAEFISARRNAYLVRARHIAMYLGKMMTPKSYPVISRALGDRDHTTIQHGVRKIEAMLNFDGDLVEEIVAIRNAIYAEAQLSLPA